MELKSQAVATLDHRQFQLEAITARENLLQRERQVAMLLGGGMLYKLKTDLRLGTNAGAGNKVFLPFRCPGHRRLYVLDHFAKTEVAVKSRIERNSLLDQPDCVPQLVVFPSIENRADPERGLSAEPPQYRLPRRQHNFGDRVVQSCSQRFDT